MPPLPPGWPKPCCGTCSHVHDETGVELICRRYPPQVTTNGSRFPTVERSDICGEYARHPDA